MKAFQVFRGHAWKAGAWLLLFALGWILGSLMTAYGLLRPAPLRIVEDAETDMPVVRILGIEDSALLGIALGDVRVFAGDEQIVIDASGSFAISDRAILTNRMTLQVPSGMQFVASKRGKKYYPVTAAESFSIIPENRVYFPSAASAEAAGFTR